LNLQKAFIVGKRHWALKPSVLFCGTHSLQILAARQSTLIRDGKSWPHSWSLGAFEAWLEAELKGDLFQPDLDKKHTKMQDNAFAFLRATYWRWAETILEICPELSDAPVVVAIGDTHLENFGTWRDVEGRLVWGPNDFDDAAPMPYALDLVRLAVSAALARNDETTSVREICETILGGYRLGLNKLEPIILDEQHRNLRENLVMPENERQKFWDKLEKTPHEPRGTQPA
jgi:Uncharacterized protein conserved in bacteria (DUF2252)